MLLGNRVEGTVEGDGQAIFVGEHVTHAVHVDAAAIVEHAEHQTIGSVLTHCGDVAPYLVAIGGCVDEGSASRADHREHRDSDVRLDRREQLGARGNATNVEIRA